MLVQILGRFLGRKKELITWWKLVWFLCSIPKQAFILWLVMKGRLIKYGDRLLSWGYKEDVNCVFCKNQSESHDHLFFECNFSYRLWKFYMSRCKVENIPIIWKDILTLELNDWCCKSLKAILYRLTLGSVVYNIWCTWNEIKHAGHPRFEEQLLKKILWEIRARVVGKGKFLKNEESCWTLFLVESACRYSLLKFWLMDVGWFFWFSILLCCWFIVAARPWVGFVCWFFCRTFLQICLLQNMSYGCLCLDVMCLISTACFCFGFFLVAVGRL